jgi:hypothetical protein
MTQVQTATVAGHHVRTRSSGEPAAMAPPGQQLKASLRELLAAAMNRVAGFAMDKVDEAAQSLEDIAANGGPKIGAVLGGVEAKLAGNNPVWGAVKGAFGSLSPAARIGIALLLLLAVVLLPVTLVLVLLGLLVLAIILLVSTRSPR